MADFDNIYGDDSDYDQAQEGLGDFPRRRPKPPWQQNTDDPGAPGQGGTAPAPAGIPPAPTPAAASQLQLPPPPNQPAPKWWQRLAAGLVGAGAGYLNTNAGRPGGIARPIDPRAAEANILGTSDYQRRLKNWTLSTQAQEKQAQLNEQQRKDDLQAEATRAQMGLTSTYRDELIQDRQNRERDLEEQRVQEFQRQNPYTADTIPTQAQQVNLGGTPLTEQPDRTQAADLPVASLDDLPAQLAQRPPLPGVMQVQRPGFVPSVPPRGYPATAPQRFAATPETAEQMKLETSQTEAQKNWPVMTQDIIDAIGDVGYKPGDRVDPRTYAALQAAYRKTIASPAAKKQDENYWRNKLILGTPEEKAQAKAWLANLTQTKQAERPINNTTFQLTPQAQAALSQPGPQTGRDEAFLATLPPQQRLQVQMADEYELGVNGSYFMSRGPGLQLATLTKRYDPGFDPSLYDGKKAMKADYTATKRGTTGGNIVSLDTLAQHSGDLITDLQALGTGNLQPFNSMTQYMQGLAGYQAPTNANMAKEAVTTELSTALKGVATEGDIKRWVDSIKPNMSPDQIQGAAQTLGRMMQRRYQTYASTFYKEFNKPWHRAISPEADAALQSFGVDTSRIKDPSLPVGAGAQLPDGGGKPLTDPKVAQQFVNAAGGDKNAARALARQHNWTF